jgi:hypothetical protein
VTNAAAEEAPPIKLAPSPRLKRPHDHVTASEYNTIRKKCDSLKAQLNDVGVAKDQHSSTEARLCAAVASGI